MSEEKHLKIAGEMKQVSEACRWVVQVAEESGLPMRDVNHLELAVDEAVTNIIEHGYGHQGEGKSIDIVVAHRPNEVRVTIIDEGPQFDPLRQEAPNPLTALDDRSDSGGGWGVFFIQKVMDEVSYTYAESKNHLVMTKRLG